MLVTAAFTLIAPVHLAVGCGGLTSAAREAVGCVFLVVGWAIISLLAFSVLAIRKRFQPSAKGQKNPLNFRASGKTVVSGSSANAGPSGSSGVTI